MGNCTSNSGGVVVEQKSRLQDSAARDSGVPPPPNPPTKSNGCVKVAEAVVPSTIENDGYQIPINVYSYSPSTLRAVAFFIHGGIFYHGDKESHPTISNGLAELGLLVVTASFRNGEEAPHETNITMQDLTDVIHYCKERWSGIPFGLVGSSSGGFFALRLSQSLVSASVDFCIPICPVADPFKRASYLRSSISGSARSEGFASFHSSEKSLQILEKQLSFWKDDDSMKEAGESLRSRQAPVPTLLIIGSADKNVPLSITLDVQSWADRTVCLGGKGHELCDKIVEGGGYDCYLSDINRFLEFCLAQNDRGTE
mmetsp:Transcript_11020/g.25640  ORF Transcript_11020/g.25640 Transcript_11020/m.25640 type:complete len:313 (+) Transcript_11020:157-1095(+)